MNKNELPPIKYPVFKDSTPFNSILKMVQLLYYSGQIQKEDFKIKKLPKKVGMAIALYIIYGWNDKGKEMVKRVCGCKTNSRLNTLNKTLRDSGFLEKDYMNNRISKLSKEMQVLRDVYKVKKKGFKTVDILYSFYND